MTTPFLEWTEHVSAAVSAVHALLALAGSLRRTPAAKTDRPRTAGEVEEEGCSCYARTLAVRVEVACAVEAVVVVRLDASAQAPAGAAAVPDGSSGGERGPW
ncbi:MULTISPECIES: hypothetical protein [unclassified Streptomyces]|uniref:hypothetical protein n=1 Tax=unclassified Streptomyces TaxID=2593676 RepID=UPI0006B01CAC|nr:MULTISPECIES: hypothetical protein [unclassified Streptomyces]